MRDEQSGRWPRYLMSLLLGGALCLGAAENREARSERGGSDGCRGIDIRKTIRVAVPPEKAFAFWEDYENFPRFMSRVREVRALDGRRSHWIASGPANIAVEWTSEITNLVPNALIEWRTEPGSSIRHDGHVRFEPDDNDRGGTRVSILLCYVPPGGALGRAIATSHTDPDSDMSEDLKRMKWLLETGQPRGAHPSLAG